MWWLYKVLFVCVFAAGSAILWLSLAGTFRYGRTSRLAMLLEQARSAERISWLHNKRNEAKSGTKERAFREKARLAGLPTEMAYAHFQLLRLGVALCLLLLSLWTTPVSGMDLMWFIRSITAVAFGWYIPTIYVWTAAARRRTGYMMEIAKLSHRLSVCVSDKADIREMLIRASRTLKLLKPHLQELTVMWGKDQRAAIWRFKEAVGISEVFPLVNALEAISQADSKAVVTVLKQQTAGIEATLSTEINRKIENAPIWISFYIMIPFSIIVILFLYPWVVTISSQLLSSFQGS
ncbi:hypothetical protein ACFQI7_23320 [Paenibacillus allorhizosphaerae]|uniref:Type II secretion system protein GspF domain-containing protein n=1 Tax=Paenibacillus allorhizosphaerae TaxID=2849866 RepID=A0ABM8VKA4_9BACL|nr:hypothetical protein [Paenibacillus allorhizosphaerae]CAG7646128.1 hypothetical protein PAECIP111802_03665 [Paenibacillus allorhizosphaerae]